MVFEAKQHAESDRKGREVAEIRNKISGQVSSIARSYSEYGWLLDNATQEMIKQSIQKARTLPPEESEIDLLKELLSVLEDGAARLSAAMFAAPDLSKKSRGRPEGPGSSHDAQHLMRSALNDLKLNKT